MQGDVIKIETEMKRMIGLEWQRVTFSIQFEFIMASSLSYRDTVRAVWESIQKEWNRL